MRACFLGTGNAGSWQIRGQQIASTDPYWLSKPMRDLTQKDIETYDVFCIVKHFDPTIANSIRKAGKKVVYDIVDAWRQPDDGLKNNNVDLVVQYFTKKLSGLPLDGVIFPNRIMQHDLAGVVPKPTTIYHHHRPGLVPTEIKQRPNLVAYEGNPDYLGPWKDIIIKICGSFGMSFAINPQSLGLADIGFAARGGPHGSIMASRYKSNVKLANFYAVGLPCVVSYNEMSYRETDNGKVYFFRTEEELKQRIRVLLPYPNRLAIHRSFIGFAKNFTLRKIADEYRRYFASL